jgi:hypothetical protein
MKPAKKTSTPKTKSSSAQKLGPGDYQPDVAFQRVEDLPRPKIIREDRRQRQTPCPHCGRPAARDRTLTRRLHEVGDLLSGRPREIELTYSQHYCSVCQKYFTVDLSDVAAARSHYTHRVMALAVRLAVEDGLPYRTASWHLWRDHRVFVPFATIQNWVEAGGKKGQRPHGS